MPWAPFPISRYSFCKCVPVQMDIPSQDSGHTNAGGGDNMGMTLLRELCGDRTASGLLSQSTATVARRVIALGLSGVRALGRAETGDGLNTGDCLSRCSRRGCCSALRGDGDLRNVDRLTGGTFQNEFFHCHHVWCFPIYSH